MLYLPQHGILIGASRIPCTKRKSRSGFDRFFDFESSVSEIHIVVFVPIFFCSTFCIKFVVSTFCHMITVGIFCLHLI